MLKKVVSGGQSGVDRAALDAALRTGYEVGGWCPAGRRAEDGPIPAHYPLVETLDGDYETRTAWNVRDSDATLILAGQPLTGGSKLTAGIAKATFHMPLMIMDPASADTAKVKDWLKQFGVATLNIAGPRESKAPGAYVAARDYLCDLLLELRPKPLTIDQCTFNFACQKRWDDLTPVDGVAHARHCGDCDRHVFFCRDDQELQWHVRKGHCIALVRERAAAVVHMVGSVGSTSYSTEAARPKTDDD